MLLLTKQGLVSVLESLPCFQSWPAASSGIASAGFHDFKMGTLPGIRNLDQPRQLTNRKQRDSGLDHKRSCP